MKPLPFFGGQMENKIKVRALDRGYFRNQLVEEGTVFYMNRAEYYHLDRDGRPKLDEDGEERVCQWVERVGNESAREIEAEPDVSDSLEEVEDIEDGESAPRGDESENVL